MALTRTHTLDLVSRASCGRRCRRLPEARSPGSVQEPGLFIVEAGSLLTTLCSSRSCSRERIAVVHRPGRFWLWFTVLFANFAEAYGGDGARRRPIRFEDADGNRRHAAWRLTGTSTGACRQPPQGGDIVMVRAGEFIPATATNHRGRPLVDESAITGESARSSASRGRSVGVTGGTRVISNDQGPHHLGAGPHVLDRMIALVEGAERQETPNEIALNILSVLTLSSCSLS